MLRDSGGAKTQRYLIWSCGSIRTTQYQYHPSAAPRLEYHRMGLLDAAGIGNFHATVAAPDDRQWVIVSE
jgi:hypothetical protein